MVELLMVCEPDVSKPQLLVEFMAGGNLLDRVEHRGPLEETESKQVR